MISPINYITINFVWKSPLCILYHQHADNFQLEQINLIFKNAKNKYFVTIPQYFSSDFQDLRFTCQKSNAEETYFKSLKVSFEDISSLKIEAQFFDVDLCAIQKIERIKYEIPQNLVKDQCYNLIVTSNENWNFSASLLKDEPEELAMENNEELNAISSFFETLSVKSNLQQEIEFPFNASVNMDDLDKMTVAQLESYCEKAIIQDKKLEQERFKAGLNNENDTLNQISEAEIDNCKLLIKLMEALDRKKQKGFNLSLEFLESSNIQNIKKTIDTCNQRNVCPMQ